MAPPTLQEQLTVDFTETLAKLVFRYRVARQLDRQYNAGVEDRLVTPGIVIRINGGQWLRYNRDQEALFAYLLERAKGYPWYAEDFRHFKELFNAQRMQQRQQQQQQQSSSTQPGTSQGPSSSATAGQRSTSLPPSFSSPASVQPQAQAPSAGQRDRPFHQNVQQSHQPHVDCHGGLTQRPQDQSPHQSQGRQTQVSTLPPIQGLGSSPRQAQTQSHMPGPTLPPMQALQLAPSAPPVAARGHPQRLETSVPPAGRPSFPPATLAQGQAYGATTVAACARSQMMIPQPMCENCGEDINLCSCISGDEDEFLIKEARKIRGRIETIDEKHEQLRATGGSVRLKEVEKKTKLEQDHKRTLRRADIIIQARWNRKARIDRDVAIANLGRGQELNTQGHQHSTTLTGNESTSPVSHQASPTLVPALSEAGGNHRAPENSKAKAKPQSLTLSGDREDDTQLASPALERGSARKGQTVLASKRQVTDPSPGATNGAMNLMRLHRPQQLGSTKETSESGMDLRSASPRKAEGGEEWREKYRDRGSKSGQDQ